MQEKIFIKLYIAGMTATAQRALVNLRAICRDVVANDDFEIEVINILEYPQAAEDEKILATPTAIRTSPLPRCVLIGDLSNREQVVAGLGLMTSPSTLAH